MKKILLILILAISFFPIIINAQPISCCKLNQNIEFDGITYIKDKYVGESSCTGGTIGTTCPTTNEATTANCNTPKWGMLCVLNSVYTVVNWVFFGLIALVALFTILGAYDILTAAGDPEKVKKGRERIMYAMIGLAVALLSRAIPGIVTGLIGG